MAPQMGLKTMSNIESMKHHVNVIIGISFFGMSFDGISLVWFNVMLFIYCLI